ncbi:Hsp20/alpha crystallin family protein [Accumulibacter sp.]|uniref:Hsp20/alpha crystallin family protein n=1 Tax=Accumulibacter sp. TaxID=2053492 RepID=UPI0025EA97F1|nr:Hsp20/alpha crystallin family protein [Accumulibacter sp.]MCM8597004.1 Hsp20/alpha crystallin family protein [Accumulibacter sp.]MCM8626250.1 Hsp20/alpha crystallin family protein [Accumulibacter sp.]MDS4051153.1 Hsp20/alpha crystallin family protein [Accumulibacter sp.]
MTSRDQSFWMWAEALELLQGAERRRGRFLTLEALRPVPCWEPSVDLYEDGEVLRLLVALPGVSARQCEVVLGEDGLIVRGRRPMPKVSHRTAIRRLEIPYGPFERRIELPPGDYRLREQFLEDGCLVLVLHRLS